jgi:hypothetical protein
VHWRIEERFALRWNSLAARAQMMIAPRTTLITPQPGRQYYHHRFSDPRVRFRIRRAPPHSNALSYSFFTGGGGALSKFCATQIILWAARCILRAIKRFYVRSSSASNLISPQ